MCVRRSDRLSTIKQKGLSCTLFDNAKMWRLRMDFWVSVPLHFTLNKVEGETAVPIASPSKTSNSQNCTTYLNVPQKKSYKPSFLMKGSWDQESNTSFQPFQDYSIKVPTLKWLHIHLLYVILLAIGRLLFG